MAPLSTKLDMEAVRREVQAYLAELERRGFKLPYLEDGKIKYTKP
jgi:hypothetical protein